VHNLENKNIQSRNVILEKHKDKTPKEIADFIISKQYRCYPENVKWPYEYKNLYQRRVQEDTETNVVCETNDRLHINIIETKFVDRPEQINTPSYSMEIVAELNGIWWALNSYALSGNDLVVRFDELEKTLIKLFNTI
jgi:hypothetical protein